MSSGAANARCKLIFRRRRSVAGAGGILQDLKFILEPRDLIGFIRLLERVAVLVAGFLDLAQSAVRVAEMLGDRRVAAGQIYCAFQLLDGALVVALLIINPTEAINVESIFRLDIERALDKFLRLAELGTFFRVA